jgi:hypothetical protein
MNAPTPPRAATQTRVRITVQRTTGARETATVESPARGEERCQPSR